MTEYQSWLKEKQVSQKPILEQIKNYYPEVFAIYLKQKPVVVIDYDENWFKFYFEDEGKSMLINKTPVEI